MLMFSLPIIVPYWLNHGMTMADVLLLQSVFAGAIIIIEIPTGYFSDVLGRRTTMIIGTTLAWIGWVTYAFADAFSGFLVAEIILGLGLSFISGTDSAMLYDTMLELGTTERAIHEEGGQMSLQAFAEAASSIVGGLLAGISLTLPFVIQAVVFVGLPICALALTEPAQHRRDGRRGSWKEIVDIVVRVVHRDKELRTILLHSSLLFSITLTMVWFAQPYWTMVGIPLAYFGILWAGANVIAGMTALRSHTLERRFGRRKLLIILTIAVVVATQIGAWFPGVIGLLAFSLFYIARGAGIPVIVQAINSRVTSDQRATVLSVRQLGVRIVFIAMAPAFGILADVTSVPTSIGVLGLIIGSGAILTVFIAQRNGTLQEAT